MSLKKLTKEGMAGLIGALGKNGAQVISPVKNNEGMVTYEPVTEKDEIAFDRIIGTYSPKDAYFPQHETLFRYRKNGNDIELASDTPEINNITLLGVRPCDAAAMISLNKVFTWDYDDNLFTERRDKAVVVSLACNEADDDCYCVAAGFSPDCADGSDIQLKKTKDGAFQVEALTDAGKTLMADNADCFEDMDATAELEPIAQVNNLDANPDKIKTWLDNNENFDHKIWEDMAAKCVGCGGCTFVCPTCHCFDIVDEPYGDQGKRVKNWDGCQFDHFTLHASGHNPRENQPQRWRNRFHCKFKIYPDRFESKGCVGCGRCIRVCPVSLDITETMTSITKAVK